MKRITFIITSAVLCISVFLNATLCSVYAESEREYGRYRQMNNLYIQSVSQGNIDDAIKASAGSLYIPAGTYVITEPIILNSGNLIGAGMDKTIIIADFEDPRQPIVVAGYKTSISNIQFRYKDGLVTGEEAKGERVAIFCGYTQDLSKGAVLENIKLKNVGTGLYSPGKVNKNDLGLQNHEVNRRNPETGKDNDKDTFTSIAFSAAFENFVIEDFSYVGIDFTTDSRTGNVFNNIYLSSGKYACQSALVFKGGESETAMSLLTIADTRATTPVVFEDAQALNIKSLALRNVSLINKRNTAYIYWSGSSGKIEHFSFSNTKVESLQSVFEIGSSKLENRSDECMNNLTIGRFMLSGVKNMTYANDFTYFRREKQRTEKFYVTVEEYYYDADRVEREVYKAFPTSDLNLIYTKKGQIATEGSTILRPTNRLCPYYTEYYDTTLGKTVIWTGEEWK